MQNEEQNKQHEKKYPSELVQLPELCVIHTSFSVGCHIMLFSFIQFLTYVDASMKIP